MPIRINLLAEAQVAEEMRRRDPVKRCIWVGIVLVAAVLTWISMLQARITLRHSEKSRLASETEQISDDYELVVATQKELNATRNKLVALHRLSTNRFLAGNLMNSMQHAIVPDVHMVKLKSSFDYVLTEAVKPKTNSSGKILTPGKPASSKERIVVTVIAEDSSSSPGDRVDTFKQKLSGLPQFENLSKTSEDGVRLTGLNPPQTDSVGRQFVSFTLDCTYPEIVR